MRLSMDKTDRCFDPVRGANVDVYFNGKKIGNVVTADEEQGYIVKYAEDDNGCVKHHAGYLLTEKYLGDVRIIDRGPRRDNLYRK